MFPTPLLSTAWLQENINDPDLIILDATLKKVGGVAPPDYENQIPGSKFFDIKKVFSDTSNELPNTLLNPEAFSKAARNLGINKRSKIILYDAWGIYSAPRAWWMFKTMGHDAVSVLNGGLPAWKAAGFKVLTKRKSHIISGNFQASFRPEQIKNAEQVASVMHQPDQIILDARSNGRFYGTTPEPRAGLRGGHIPNSKSLPWPTLVKDGKLLPETELKKIFEELNTANKKITCTCGSGITAAIIYFAAYVAGHKDLSLYDGSWTDWAQNLDLPVNK